MTLTPEIDSSNDPHELAVYPKRGINLVRGDNALVWDDQGREYIDCIAGQGSANIGHANPYVVKAITEQARTLITCPGIFGNEKRREFLRRLTEIAPSRLQRGFLCNSGTEAVEAAMKFARISTGRSEIICATKAFHGRTFGALSATFNPKYREGFEPLLPDVHHVTFNKLDKLEGAVSERTAAVMLEIIQGEGGVNIGTREFLCGAQELCRKREIILIIDEIQTGFARTGKMFACEHFGLSPDLLCLAKSIAGGVPMGAVLCSEKIKVETGKHGSTFGGNPLCCAAGLATLDFIRDSDLVSAAQAKGELLRSLLVEIKTDKIREIRNLGLMFGIELKERSQLYIEAMLKLGVLVLPAGPTVLRLLPPLTIEIEQLKKVSSALSQVLS